MKKLILGIFISLGAIFLMSHNASALTTTFSLDDYTPVNRIVYHLVDCSFYVSSTSSVTGVSQCSSNASSVTPVKLMQIKSNLSYTLKKGDIITFDVVNYTPDVKFIQQFNWMAFKGVSNDMYLMDYESVFQEYANHSYYNVIDDAYTIQYSLNSAMRFTFFVTKDISSQIGLVNTDVNYNPIASYLQLQPNSLKWNIINLVIYRKSGKSQINQEQEEATQNAVDDSEISGSNSQNSSQGATNNLLSVFTGFANVITNASATNCVINAPLNTTFSNDRLNVDLCGLSIPPAIGALTSIIAVMAVVPFALSMFNKFIAIMQGFQR